MFKNKKAGKLIVRTEAQQTSNEVLTFMADLRDVRARRASCMGLCGESYRWRLQVQRSVPSNPNQFVMVWQSDLFGLGDATSRVPLTKLNMATLCNNDKLARIKFAIVASNPAATELDSVLTTVDEI